MSFPPEIGTELKFLFATVQGGVDPDIFYFDSNDELLHANWADPKTQRDPDPFGRPPAMTEHITAVSPAHASAVPQSESKETGVCAEARFDGLTEQGTWFRLYLDGEEVTLRSAWTVDLGQSSFAAPNGRLCYSPGAQLSEGRHTAMVEVRDPRDPSAPAIEAVTWAFEVVP